ncbi:hypothetical protein L3X38_041821 [Prunus dulcis]|uniref:GAG-pre-integrase domain-containing protein n=1 Tax=Prunus dulcis TaxID=3755 RepID=A0AAD4UTZ0_PRUDU|nr:hypothetical protein L3X38_041821 [Prunus dulcis]
MTPFHTVDQAYAYVRHEDVRQAVMMGSSDRATGAGLAAKSATRSGPPTRAGQPHNSSTAAHLQIQSYATAAGAPLPKTIPPSRPKAPTDGSGCTHYGNLKHTGDTCFKLNGYLDWWEDLCARKLKETASNSGRVAIVSTEPPLALFPQIDPSDSLALPDVSGNCGYAFHTSDLRDTTGWIIDSGATNHMTFDPNDFLHTTAPRRTSIASANGVTYLVTGAGTDILTKEIIGRGTKRGGLYYVDDFSMGHANSVKHPSDDKYRQIWLWHRRLGDPSFGYMRYLLPKLFSVFKDSDFKCDTCILAKSHRASYPLSMNKSTIPFALIHSYVWGPSPISTHSGIRWFVTFIDDCTRMT